MAEKQIRVKIKALVEGLNELRAFGDEMRRLQAAPAGGGGVGAGGSAGDVRALATEIHALGEEIKKLEPSKLRKIFEVVGNAGALLTGLSRFKEAQTGARQAVDQVKQLAGAVSDKVTAGVGKLTEGVTTLGARLPSLAGGAAAGAGGLAVLGGGAAAATVATGGLILVVLGLVAAITSLAVAAAVAVPVLQKIFDRGIDYNSQLEQVRLGIASVVASLAELNDGFGGKLEGASALEASFVIAGDQLEKLKVDAIQTVATFEQIAPAFQAAIGPGLAAGLTLDQIRATTVKIVQAASGIGVPLNQINQEVRAILEGTINEDARLAKVLGISNEMVKSWRAQGTLAQELNKRLEKFTLAGERAANTLGGLKSNLVEAFNVFSGEATTRAFDEMKSQLQRLLPQLFDFKSARLDQSFKPLSDIIDEIFVRGIRVAGRFIEGIISGVKAISRFVGENRAQFDRVLDSAENILRTSGRIGSQLLSIISDAHLWSGALNKVGGILTLIEVTLVAISIRLEEIMPGLRLLLGVAAISMPNFGGVQGAGAAHLQGKSSDAPQGVASVRLNPDGSLVGARGGRGGGGSGKSKGGGGKGSSRAGQIASARAELARATLELQQAVQEAGFRLFKDALDREQTALDAALEDRLVSLTDYYREAESIQQRGITNEIANLRSSLAAARGELQAEIERIRADKNLSGEEKRLKEQSARAKFAKEEAQTNAEILVLERSRGDATEKLRRDHEGAARALREQLQAIENELLRLQGQDKLADENELDARFREIREKAVAEGDLTGVAFIDALKARLKKQIQFDDVKRKIDAQFEKLRDFDDFIDAQVRTGQIGTEEADRRKLEMARLIRREMETLHGELKGIAERTKDPELLRAVDRLGIEIAEVGVEVDRLAQTLNENLRNALEDTLFKIIRRQATLKEAITGFINHILDELARLAASSIVRTLFGEDGIFGGIFGGSSGQGGIGGILSKIFGRAPQGNPSATGGRVSVDDTIRRIPGVITNLTTANTAQTVNVLRFGFAGVNARLQQIASILPSLAGVATVGGGSIIGKIIEFGGRIADKKFASGGLIDGPGTETSDSILARLSRGEFVVKAASVRRIGPDVMSFINRFGALPAFAEGGLVGAAPAFATGGAPVHLTQHFQIVTKDAQSFRESEHTIKRNLARAAQEGVRRAQTRTS